MTALINDRSTPQLAVKSIGLPVAVGTPICFKGARACVDTTTGLCVPGKPSTTLVPVGLFAERVDNVTGVQTVLAQVSLDREILLRWYANDGSVTAAALLQDCYILDDQTVTMNATGNSKSGRIWQVDPVKGVAVETGAATNAGPTTLVVAKNRSQQVVPDSSLNATLTNWTEAFDTLGSFDPVTGLFTAPADGFYQVATSIVATSSTASFFLAVLVNNVAQLQPGDCAGGVTSLGGLVHLLKGDVLRVGLSNFSGVSVTLFNNAGVPGENYLTIAKVG